MKDCFRKSGMVVKQVSRMVGVDEIINEGFLRVERMEKDRIAKTVWKSLSGWAVEEMD